MIFPTPSADWYRTFFIAPFNELWDRVVSEDATRRETQFLLARLQLKPGAKIVDVPCGSGRISVALAAAGYAVTGVDLSSDALERANARMRKAGVIVTLKHADMREVPPTQEFDAALCLGNSFGYLTHEGMIEFLAALARTLRPGGRAVIHTALCAESILTSVKPQESYDFGDIRFEIHNRYDAARSRLETGYVLTQGTQTWRQYGSQQVYTVAELGRMLAANGLNVLALYSGVEARPYALGEGELYVLAQTPTR